ncbi:MAG: hemopexin repeat-containing protein [Bacteroidota bacterium]
MKLFIKTYFILLGLLLLSCSPILLPPAQADNHLKMITITSNPFKFSNRIDASIHEAYRECFEAITENSDIQLAMYMWNLKNKPAGPNSPSALAERLIAQVKSKQARAQLAFDIDYFKDKGQVESFAQKFQEAGIEMIWPKFKGPKAGQKAKPKFHDKTLLFDRLRFDFNNKQLKDLNGKEIRYVVVQTSANIWPSQYSQSNQMILYYGNKEFYDFHRNRYERLKAELQSSQKEMAARDYSFTKNDGSVLVDKVKSYDFPRKNKLARSILNNIDTSKGYVNIRLCMGNFSDTGVAEKLAELAKDSRNSIMVIARAFRTNYESGEVPGFVRSYQRVEEILRKSKVNYFKLDEAAKEGRPYATKVHGKYLLIDAFYPNGSDLRRRKLAFAGSLNYTGTGQNKNSETLVRIEDDKVYNDLLKNWNELRFSKGLNGVNASLSHKDSKAIYFFNGNKYVKWKAGEGLEVLGANRSTRDLGREGWKQIHPTFSTNIDASFQHPENKRTYFFKGDKYMVWESGKGPVGKKLRIIGVDGWKSLPAEFKRDIDAALSHPSNGNIYFFKGDKYCVWKPGKGVLKPAIRTMGNEGWQLPTAFRSNLDAAVEHPSNGNIYFFKGQEYCVWKPGSGVQNPASRKTGSFGWQGLFF